LGCFLSEQLNRHWIEALINFSATFFGVASAAEKAIKTIRVVFRTEGDPIVAGLVDDGFNNHTRPAIREVMQSWKI
jgi:hypothetical protein